MTRHAVPVLLAGTLLLPGLAAAAVPKAAPPGRIVDAPDGRDQMEMLSVDPALAPALLSVPAEGSLRIEEWPVAPGVRQTVVVARHDVYAPDAKVVAIDQGREIEVPRSKLVFLWGSAEGDGSTAVVITVDPDTGAVSGSSMAPDGSYDLVPPSPDRPRHLLASTRALRADAAGGFQCGFGDLPKDEARERLRAERLRSPSPQVLTSMHTGVVAVDTDNELMGTKFSNNTTNAANYIAQLFAGLNAIYQRDLFVQLFQGYTILRLSTTPDPYVQNAGGGADGPKLQEVSTYWNTNYGGIKRMLVIMLSGKQPNDACSGIAWIGGLCSGTYGMSFNQVFRTGTTAGSGDFQLVGHEMGHNFGAPHTHCTDTDAVTAGIQPIDYCNSAECGTTWNPPSGQVCPASFTVNPANGAPVTGVRGTLMSYCHLLGGCGVTNVFHPQSISLAIGPEIDSAVGQCLFPATANPPPTVTGITPASGPASGGTAVTLSGTGFRSPASVAFGDLGAGKAAPSVVVVSPTTITATTPAHTLGLKDVVVMNPDQRTGTLKNGFNYVPAISVSSISPNGGTTAGGTAVTITGTTFAAPATVTLGGAAATTVNVANATTITATTGPHAAGIVDVVVQSNSQTATLRSAYFYFTPAPGRLYTLAPCRLVDTRNATGPRGGPPLPASGRRNFTLTNVCGIPATATAISVNLTVTGGAAPGFVTLFPGNGLIPPTSNINFSTGQTRANNAVVLLATDGSGSLAVLNGAPGTVHFILDVNGYFQ